MRTKATEERVARNHGVSGSMNPADTVHMTYDREADAAYYALVPDRKGKVAHTVKLQDGLFADLDASGKLLGVEMLFLSFTIPKASRTTA